MATCKECLHYEACDLNEAYWVKHNADQACSAFKDKSEYVEQKHGRWIFKHDPITDPKKYFIRIVCSECNLHTGQKSNYCPNCGAKMECE